MSLTSRSKQAALACCVAALAGCARADTKGAVDSTPVTPAAAGSTSVAAPSSRSGIATTTPISLADIAGSWHVRSVPEHGPDTSVIQYTLTTTRDSSGWKILYNNGLTVPLRVSASGDSVITDAGPYQSARRRRLEVTAHAVFRHAGDRLVGRTIGHYKTRGADSVRAFRTEATRVP